MAQESSQDAPEEFQNLEKKDLKFIPMFICSQVYFEPHVGINFEPKTWPKRALSVISLLCKLLSTHCRSKLQAESWPNRRYHALYSDVCHGWLYKWSVHKLFCSSTDSQSQCSSSCWATSGEGNHEAYHNLSWVLATDLATRVQIGVRGTSSHICCIYRMRCLRCADPVAAEGTCACA